MSNFLVRAGAPLQVQDGIGWLPITLPREQVMSGPHIRSGSFSVLTADKVAYIVRNEDFNQARVTVEREVLYLTGIGFRPDSTKENIGQELDLLHHVTLPSMAAQTDVRFRWIVVLNTDLLDTTAALPVNLTGLQSRLYLIVAFEGEYPVKSEDWGKEVWDSLTWDEDEVKYIATATLPAGAALNVNYNSYVHKFMQELKEVHGVLEFAGGIAIHGGDASTARYVKVQRGNPLSVLVESFDKSRVPITAAHPNRDGMTNKRCRLYKQIPSRAGWLYVLDRPPKGGEEVGKIPLEQFGLTDELWQKLPQHNSLSSSAESAAGSPS